MIVRPCIYLQEAKWRYVTTGYIMPPVRAWGKIQDAECANIVPEITNRICLTQ